MYHIHMILGIAGAIGSGKDTIADYLVNFHEFRRESWAGTLKDAISVVFGWDRILLEGKTKQSREWRELPDKWWSNKLNKTITPRNVLQEWGTDVCRQGYHDNIWVASLENKLLKITDDIVISDCRFENELASVKNLGGITIRVSRGQDPEWMEEYKRYGKTQEFLAKYKHIHSSEFTGVDLEYDYVIKNDGTIEELYQQVNDLLKYHQSSK